MWRDINAILDPEQGVSMYPEELGEPVSISRSPIQLTSFLLTLLWELLTLLSTLSKYFFIIPGWIERDYLGPHTSIYSYNMQIHRQAL